MKVPVAVPDLTGNEERYVVDAIRSSWISSQGSYLDRFEREFAEICGTRNAVAVSNGTVALHLSLVALGIGPGHEVIVPSLTYIASVNAIRYVGATPVFADVAEETWCLDPRQVERLVTKKTRAVIAVHLYGQPAEMDQLTNICERYGLHLVEDAAEAPFGSYHSRPVGALGELATFSFYGNKLVTSGEGGAVTVNDDRLAERLRRLRGQGMDPERRYWFPEVGYNYRLTNVAAAILCAQLERRDDFLSRRRVIFERYSSRLAGLPGVEFQRDVPGSVRSPWLYTLLINKEFGTTRDQLMSRLGEAGIETRPFFPPVHKLPPYEEEGRVAGVLPITDSLSARGLNLPTYNSMTEVEVDLICDEITSCASGRS
jgi:perosamine synthetase